MTRTSEAVLLQQEADAARNRAAAANKDTRPRDRLDLGDKQRQADHYSELASSKPQPSPANAVVASDGGVVARATAAAVEATLNAVAPRALRPLSFTKAGQFVTRDDQQPIPQDRPFVAILDQTITGWIRFFGPGNQPELHCGLLYGGFVMPPRESLSDPDPVDWPENRFRPGEKEDCWQLQIVVPLEDGETGELFAYAARSKTARRAVGNLLRVYNKQMMDYPDTFPVVHLKPSGYNDKRYGWVATPAFAIVGRRDKSSSAKPDTSAAADLDDSIPF